MLKVSQLMQVSVFSVARGGGQSLVGQIRQVVFCPEGDRVVGFLVRRPDVAGMVKREDAFLALDAFEVGEDGLVATKGADSFDDRARERLGLDWDACILWTGMDARTTDGKELGWVDDVSFYPQSGRVHEFHVGDGSVAKSLVGNVIIPADMLRGYKDGFMLVDPEAATLALDGGLAAKAGESYARAKHTARQTGQKAMTTGAHKLGHALGKAKKATGRTRGMFGAFMDEYKKASK